MFQSIGIAVTALVIGVVLVITALILVKLHIPISLGNVVIAALVIYVFGEPVGKIFLPEVFGDLYD